MQPNQQAPIKRTRKQKIVRALLLAVGTISLALGAIGIFLPILPTTPFLLLSAACYMRSSERMHKWLLSKRWFGAYIRNYQEAKGYLRKQKYSRLLFFGLLYFIQRSLL
jgi:uncharacterized protein